MYHILIHNAFKNAEQTSKQGRNADEFQLRQGMLVGLKQEKQGKQIN